MNFLIFLGIIYSTSAQMWMESDVSLGIPPKIPVPEENNPKKTDNLPKEQRLDDFVAVPEKNQKEFLASPGKTRQDETTAVSKEQYPVEFVAVPEKSQEESLASPGKTRPNETTTGHKGQYPDEFVAFPEKNQEEFLAPTGKTGPNETTAIPKETNREELLTSPVKSHPDEILSLPGLNEAIDFKQYSGYLNVSNDKFLFYWFVESRRSPTNDPLLLWLNGGPGCSSLDGLLSELGPFHIKSDGQTLYKNPYSWNNIANVLFVETPVGVGFSYSLSKNYMASDDTVADDNYIALQVFFEKFPQFRKNEFYVTGESYAGVYVPTLSVKILNGPMNINFKGFAIGNGCLDRTQLPKSLVFFGYYHGLVGDQVWDRLTKYCCGGVASKATCNFYGEITLDCYDAMNITSININNPKLNIYNLYDNCAASIESSSRYALDMRNLLELLPRNALFPYQLEGSIPCIDSSNETFYLNQKVVRDALHIPDFVQYWTVCNIPLYGYYTKIYDTMEPQLLQMIHSGKIRGLIYNGDVDMACNFLGDEWISSSLNLPLLKVYEAWEYNDQIAGYATYYENLTFLTVKGSGHMVPQDAPGPSLKMISNFLKNVPI